MVTDQYAGSRMTKEERAAERNARKAERVAAWLSVIEQSARDLELELLSRHSETASETGTDPEPPPAERRRPRRRLRRLSGDGNRTRDERPTRPDRPERGPCARGRESRSRDHVLDRRALGARPAEHAPLGRDGATRLVHGGRRPQHAAARGDPESLRGSKRAARRSRARRSSASRAAPRPHGLRCARD